MNEYESYGERELIQRIEELEDKQRDLEDQIKENETIISGLEDDITTKDKEIEKLYNLSVTIPLSDNDIEELRIATDGTEVFTACQFESNEDEYIDIKVNIKKTNYL